jgi:hypothetical protein
MNLRIGPLIVVMLCASLAWGQQTIYEESRVPFRKEFYGGVMLHGDGWGVQFYRANYRTATQRFLLGLELVGMKHPKEVKSFNPYYEDSRGYFYGKSNSFLILRPSIGGKRQITDKIRRSGVEVNYVWGIGPAIGLVKPVYLQIGKPDIIPYQSIVIERYDPGIHDVQNIYGRATWFRGLGELGLRPGVFGRFGFNFEYSGQTTGLKALEAGVSVDAFPTVIPIMAELEGVVNKQIFLQFYLALQFGKKTIQ